MKQNRLILAITYSAIALFTLISLSTEAQNTPKTIKRIIIDPGHGGTDPGSNGKYSTEAAVSLAISLKLEEYINESIPDVEVVLTRRTDIYNSVVEKAFSTTELYMSVLRVRTTSTSGIDSLIYSSNFKDIAKETAASVEYLPLEPGSVPP